MKMIQFLLEEFTGGVFNILCEEIGSFVNFFAQYQHCINNGDHRSRAGPIQISPVQLTTTIARCLNDYQTGFC